MEQKNKVLPAELAVMGSTSQKCMEQKKPEVRDWFKLQRSTSQKCMEQKEQDCWQIALAR